MVEVPVSPAVTARAGVRPSFGRPRPGDLLLCPASVISVVVLLVNDHVLKARFGAEPVAGVLTGKLSDVAGLVFFPLLLISLAELGRRAMGTSPWTTTPHEVTMAVAVTGIGFAAVQVVPAAADLYVAALATLRWLPRGLTALVTTAPWPPLPHIHHVRDAADCLTLPALWLAHRSATRLRRERQYASERR